MYKRAIRRIISDPIHMPMIAVAYILVVVMLFWGLYVSMDAAGSNTLQGSGIGGGGTGGAASARENIVAVWIATVSNINYPSAVGLDSEQLSAELDEIVKNVKELGANTIFFQVRPCSDALYDSDIFPPSSYVSGKRGEKADGDFDSLSYLIGAAHSEGIAVHAWINPVRVLGGSQSNAADLSSLCSDEPAALHPEWTVQYDDGKIYYDLGIPEVRALIAEGVYEVVSRYAVDGVVFDDYFYPYPTRDKNGKLAEFDDAATYKKYGGKLSLSDFRRESVNALIRVCSIAVKKGNKAALFGVAPFGIWRNSTELGGAGTSGLEAYSEIYCDALAFAREGNVDYIAPQLYWGIGDPSADFSILAEWWSNALLGTKTAFIPCLAAYRYSSGGYESGELTEQLRRCLEADGYAGVALYGYAALIDDALSVGDELRFYSRYARSPTDNSHVH